MNKRTADFKPRPKIMIASPVCQTYPILQCFLQSLKRLDASEFDILYDFIDDNDEKAASELLEQFAADHPHTTLVRAETQTRYTRNETTHYWNDELVWKVAQFKDSFIQRALSLEFDALLLIDSDLLLHPQTLAQLYHSEAEIVSEIFWTRWQPDSIPQPQVWLRDEYDQWAQQRGEQLDAKEKAVRTWSFFNILKSPGLYKVGGLGACTMIRRSALERGVCFKPIYNLSFWGEDRHFCIRAAALGLELYVDTHYPAYHIYRLSDLDGAAKYMDETTGSTIEEDEKPS